MVSKGQESLRLGTLKATGMHMAIGRGQSHIQRATLPPIPNNLSVWRSDSRQEQK